MPSKRSSATVLRSGVAAVLMILAAGCGTTGDPAATPTPTESSGTTVTSTPTQSSGPTASPTASYGPGLEGAVIEPGGLGPLRVGMPLGEVQANGWAARDEICEDWDVVPELRDKGVSVTFDQERIYEIWVAEPTFATAEGITVGATLAELEQAYGADLQTETREGGGGPYTARFVEEGEHELLFLAESPQDDRTKAILARKAGTEVVEGC